MIRLIHCFFAVILVVPVITEHRSCTDLLLGQFLCGEEEINPDTQLPKNCSKDHTYTLGMWLKQKNIAFNIFWSLKNFLNLRVTVLPSFLFDAVNNLSFELTYKNYKKKNYWIAVNGYFLVLLSVYWNRIKN